MRRYSDKIFDIINITIMIVLLFVFIWPLWFVIIASISDPNALNRGEVLLLPMDITFEGYERILQYKSIWLGYANTIYYTAIGTAANMIMSILLAYPLSVPGYRLKKFMTVFYMISMYFGGGLIPSYLLIRDLGLLDTRAVMIISAMVSIYNSLIIRSYFQNSIPGELKEAAILDGANDAQYLVKVVMPLSKPVFAVVGLYYLVGHWNNYTRALYYVYNDKLLPLQNVLRRLLISGKLLEDVMSDPEMVQEAVRQSQLMQYGVIIIASLPVLCIYPFVQKHFVKGVMVGAIKG